MKPKKVDWLVLIEANGVYCEECAKTENKFITHFCNAKTCGLSKYGHKEFQLVLHMQHEMILYTLNALGRRVQSGRVFKDGEVVSDLFDGYNALLKEFEEDGKKALRVIIPDANHKFPDDEGCDLEYRLQGLPIEKLYNNKIN